LNLQPTILIVDDDRNVLEVLNARLLSAGYRVRMAPDANEGIDIIKKEDINGVISDVKMPGMDGMAFLNEIRRINPGLPVIFLTAYANIPEAVHAVKAGAVDYLEKPFDGHDLVKKLEDTLSARSSHADPDSRAMETADDFYWGESKPMKSLYDMVRRVAKSDVNVMITGESGVGKERIARLIHEKGPRKEQPFIVVDCGSTANGLLETELFGHIKGSFTHAIRDKKGLIEAADKGTLFLDEVGNISSDMQMRLLRFLEERKIRRIGTVDAISVDCRVISATNTDLVEAMNKGEFRQDLYYRLRGVTIHVPALRDRKKDIPALARFFATAYGKAHRLEKIDLPQETIDRLLDYDWPGNVRELKNSLEAGIVLCRDGVLRPSDLQFSGLSGEMAGRMNGRMSGDNADSWPDGSFSIEESERHTIVRALKQAGGVQKHAADLLGISRRAIHYKIKKYGIDISSVK